MLRYDVFNAVANSVQTAYPSAYVGSAYEPVPAQFPYVWVHELTEADASVDLASADDIHLVQFEAQVFSKDECSDLVKAVRTAFKGIYFEETLTTFVENADPTIERVTMRFQRRLGAEL